MINTPIPSLQTIVDSDIVLYSSKTRVHDEPKTYLQLT